MSYKLLTKIKFSQFRKKKILVIGAGQMAIQYCIALSKMKIEDVTVLSKSRDRTINLCKEFGFKPIFGGFQKKLFNIQKMDLVIVATPVNQTIPAAIVALDNGQKNILIEKPGSLYPKKLLSLARQIKGQRIRVAYNRLTYPNYYKLKELIKKEGGISSCRFEITEIINKIPFPKKGFFDIHKRRGIHATSHVISIVVDLIGIPKQIYNFQRGRLSWHPSGSVFVGSGISKKGIPFSYHGDWNSSGRWGVEIMTKKNAYRMIPLEDLYVCSKGSFTWKKVPFKVSLPKVKLGVAEEIAVMLDRKLEKKIKLSTLEQAATVNEFAAKIFGYN